MSPGAAAGAGVILVLVAIYSFMFIHLDSGLTGAMAETNDNNIQRNFYQILMQVSFQ